MRGDVVIRTEARGLRDSMTGEPSRRGVVSGAPAGSVLGSVWRTCERCLRTLLSRGCEGEFRGREIAFDTGQAGGFPDSVAVVQRLPRALHVPQDLVPSGFPLNRLGVLIPPVQNLSDILPQCRDHCRGSVLQAFPGHLPAHTFHLIEPRTAGGSVMD